MFDIIPGDVVSSNILAVAAAMTQVLRGLCALPWGLLDFARAAGMWGLTYHLNLFSKELLDTFTCMSQHCRCMRVPAG